jgi:hypothetical protein
MVKYLEMSKVLFTFALTLLLSCKSTQETPRVTVKIAYTDTIPYAVLYPRDVLDAYYFMYELRQEGCVCNKELTVCEGENVYIYRVVEDNKFFIIIKIK